MHHSGEFTAILRMRKWWLATPPSLPVLSPPPLMDLWGKVAASLGLGFTLIFNAFPDQLPFLPLGRTTPALLAAAWMVATGLIGPESAYKDIDHNTLAFLFGMMALKCLLAKHRFAIYLRQLLLWRHPSWQALMMRVGLLSAALSSIITNDATCVFLTPIVQEIALKMKYPMMPLMLAICTNANIGSAATITGNPQNVLIGSYSDISFWRFTVAVGPAAVAGVTVNLALLRLYAFLGIFADTENIRTEKRNSIDYYDYDDSDEEKQHATENTWLKEDAKGNKAPSRILTESDNLSELEEHIGGLSTDVKKKGNGKIGIGISFSLVVMLCLFLRGYNVGWSTAGVALMAMALEGIATQTSPSWVFNEVDWSIIGWFVGTFIVMLTFGKTDITTELWRYFIGGAKADYVSFLPLAKISIAALVFSNIVSNVPLILLMAPDIFSINDPTQQEFVWVVVSWVSTIAGNLTLLGSAANIIVAELNSTRHLTFFPYLKFGLPTTLIIVSLGLFILHGTSAIL